MANISTRNILDGMGKIIITNVPAGKRHKLEVLGENVEIPVGVRTITGILELAERMLPVIRETRQAAVLKMLAEKPDEDGGYDIVPAPRDDMPLAEITIQGEGSVKFPAVGDECPTCGYTGHRGILVDGHRLACPTCNNTGILDQRGVDILMGATTL